MTARVKNVQLKLALLALLFFSSDALFAQRIKNESVIRNVSSDHYFRLYYENDFITMIDYYYTSGMNIELVSPSLKKNLLNKVFFRVAGSKMKYGLALDHYAFTPLHIINDEILYGDRPYAGCISVSSFQTAIDERRRRRISTSLALGIIGPATQWKSVQTFLHKHVIAAPQPMGWDHQIKNDLILNYKVNFEKNVIGTNFFILNADVEAAAGTINDKLSTGLSIMLGKFNDPYKFSARPVNKWQLYVFGHSFFSAVAYDATLQGGMLNKKSPYTISNAQMERFTLQHQIGLVAHHKKISIELSESFLSKEFKTGRSHIWGGLGIGIDLK
jgi:hypothetical protein